MTAAHHNIVGLQRSGKTTYLAALWHLIQSGEVSTKIVLDKLVGDLKYLNAITEAWRRCEVVPRTSMKDEKTISIYVHEPSHNRKAVLSFPDLSGESFDQQVEARICRQQYVESFADPGGVLLFVTANRVTDGIPLVDFIPAIAGAAPEQQEAEAHEWSPKLIPAQVRLVELLQFLQQPPFPRRRRRLAIIVSAWDTLPMPRPTPDSWVARELPLLHQFLITNAVSFPYRIYGISAQGGELMEPRRSQLLSMRPSDRIECVGPDIDPHDLTGPIVWLREDA